MKIQEKVLLNNYSTFKIGGPAKYFVEVKTIKELKEAIKFAEEKKEKFIFIGGGSNILFHDKGFDGLVIKLVNREMKLKGKEKIVCEAGVMLSGLVSFAKKNNLSGLEWASGIPGTVGGAIRGNAGAFGFEMKDVVEEAVYFNLDTLKEEKCNNEKCEFDYRQSVFKEFDKKIIWQATFKLKRGKEKEIEAKGEEILKKRREKNTCLGIAGSVGSIFKNPVVGQGTIDLFEKETDIKCKGNKVPAAWLIDMCGLRGFKMGKVQVSEDQANFILNTDGATADEVIILISLMKQKVRNKYGVQLEEEVEIVSY